MANSVNYIPQVDYTSRDYSAIRDDLLNLINQYNPAWTSRDPSDLGMTLVELFAYMGDLMNFYTDRAANEGFLATASQRDSILQMAAMLGYAPTKAVAATTTLTLTNSTASAVTFPAKTQVATTAVVNGLNTQVVFETDAEVTVAAKVSGVNGTASVAATEGVTTTL
jgi:predicted phage baseplate assembly protein